MSSNIILDKTYRSDTLFDELEQILKILFTIIKKSKGNGKG